MIEAEVDRRLQAEAQLREEREKQERQLILLEKEQVCTSSVPTYFLLDWLGLIFVRLNLYIFHEPLNLFPGARETSCSPRARDVPNEEKAE